MSAPTSFGKSFVIDAFIAIKQSSSPAWGTPGTGFSEPSKEAIPSLRPGRARSARGGKLFPKNLKKVEKIP